MKKIMIIGAGFLQTYVIKKAKELGYYTVAVDGNPDAEGFKYCDEYKAVNIVDENACLEYAKSIGIDGVLTAATDYGVLSSSYVARELNLSCINYESAKCIKNKYQVRKKLNEANADDTGKCFEISCESEFDEVMRVVKYPVMVKPCDGSGSRGAAKVENESGFKKACIDALGNSLSHKALIEPFINGQEYGVESFVYNNEIFVLGVMKKKMTNPPYYAELGHCIPSELSEELELKVKDCVTKAIKALGVNFGSVNMDLLITNNGDVHIVDVGARMGGNLIGSHIIPAGTGIDYIENMIKAAVGDKADFSPCKKPQNVSSRLLALTPGIVKKLPDFKQIEDEYNVVIEHHLNEGDIIHEYHTNLDGCGYVVSVRNSLDDAIKATTSAWNCINTSIIRGEKYEEKV